LLPTYRAEALVVAALAINLIVGIVQVAFYAYLPKVTVSDRIAVLMGGRASEQMIYDGDVSTGAADDLQRATEIAIEMVTKHGMDPKVGQRTYAPRPQTFLPALQDTVVSAAEATSREIDLAVRDLIEAGGACARAILERRRSDLDAGVELLIARETLTAEEFAPLRPVAALAKAAE
jgi:cell division protease FtsH